MSQLDPKYLIIPSAWLKGKATLPGTTPEQPAQYDIDFGYFENLVIKPGGDLKEVWSPGTTGGLGLYDVQAVKQSLDYEGELKFLTPSFLAYYMGAASGSAPRPRKVFKLFMWVGFFMEGEPVVSGGSNIGDSILRHHSFQAALTLDGDITADGESHAKPKLTARVLLGAAPGIWTAGARPVVQTA